MSGWTTVSSDRSPATETGQVIETEHLWLVPLGLADAAAIVHGHRPAGARWADGYPTDRTLVAAGLVVTAGEESIALGPYRSYQMVRREDGVVIGDCGFLGPPDERGELHLGFGVADALHSHRYAAEALQALIEWAHEQPGVTRILADAARTNIAALRVMAGAGMRRAGEESGLVLFEA